MITARDVDCIYEVPLTFHKEGLDKIIVDLLSLSTKEPDLSIWERIVEKVKAPESSVVIAVVGKYVNLKESYKSLNEAIVHGGIDNNARVKIDWIDAEEVERSGPEALLANVDGILVPGGFGERGIEGKISVIQYARENKIPFFGICLGMQCAVIEFARNVVNLKEANSSEFAPHTSHPVIDLLPEQDAKGDKGGTMRLGAYPCQLKKNSFAYKAYGNREIYERHRHRYEFNNKYRLQMEEAGLSISGISPDGNLVEIIEIEDHPWFLAGQFHPEFKSSPMNPHPLFRDFIKVAIENSWRKNVRE